MRPEADIAGQILFRQQFRVEAVVKVVTVIGDFVGEIGDLCFERGIFRFKTLAPSGMVVGGVMLGQPFTDLPRQIQQKSSLLNDFFNNFRTLNNQNLQASRLFYRRFHQKSIR